MKKRNGLLILSALAALGLASCGGGDQPKSSSTTSQEQESSSVVPSESSVTPTTSSTGETTSESSVVPSSESSSEAPSWKGKPFLGEFYGGFSSIIFSEDMTTSWGTDQTKYPATCADVGNGVYHIVSTNAVPKAERVDVYTDGTMLFMIHDATANDLYVMDKNADYDSAFSLVKNANDTVEFGSIEIDTTNSKYFAKLNDVYTFGVNITLSYGESISADGAIFDAKIGGATATYHVIKAGAAGAFGTIEPYNLVTTTYHGDEGDLVIGLNGDQFVFARLSGQDLSDVTYENGVLTHKTGERTLDTTSAPIQWVSPATAYTLDANAKTYTVSDATYREDAIHELQMTDTSYSCQVGTDGNLWAQLTPTASGDLTVEEIASTSNDGYLAIYEATAKTYTSDYAIAKSDSGAALSGAGKISNLSVSAGKTYIIKAGAWGDRNLLLGGTGSTHAGATETISLSFVAYTTKTYTSSSGDTLALEYRGTALKTVAYNGEAVTDYTVSQDKTTYTTSTMTIDWTNPSDPIKTITERVFVVDEATMTFTVTETPRTEHLVIQLDETSTGATTVVGEDGNLWASFVPTCDGQITVEETVSTTSDGYIAIYDSTASSFSSAFALKKADSGAALSGAGKITDFEVTAGTTYIIKAGAYADRDKLMTGTGSSNKGKTETISFTFGAYTSATYTGDEGDLVISYAGTNVTGIKLNNATLAGGTLKPDGTAVVVKGSITVNNSDPLNPTRTSTDQIYTLDEATHTYAKTTGTVTEPIFQAVSEADSSFEGTLGPDGSLWGKFTPTASGTLTMEAAQHIGASSSSYNYLAIFNTTASPFTSSGTAISYQSSSGKAKVSNVEVLAGQTYIIKLSPSYTEFGNAVTATGSTSSGLNAKCNLTFTPYTKTIYHDVNGVDEDLAFLKLGNEIKGITFGEQTLQETNYLEAVHMLTSTTRVIDRTTDPANPVMTSTTYVFMLDDVAGTYTLTRNSVDTTYSFQVLDESSTSCTATVGADGNLWAIFTPTTDGEITIEETASTTTDGYLSVYKPTAPAYTTAYNQNYAIATADSGASGAYGWGKISNLQVKAGESYIIKAGSYSDRTRDINGTESVSTGSTETISFLFEAYTSDAYTDSTGVGGDLVIQKKNGIFTRATVGGVEIEGAVLSTDGLTLTIPSEGHLDVSTGEPIITSDATTYTMDAAAHTYTKTTATSQPFNICQTTMTGTGTFTAVTQFNGLAVIKFVPAADGNYTITASYSGNVDIAMGIYTNPDCISDPVCPMDSYGYYLQDSAFAGGAESFTITNAVAGTAYFIKVGYYDLCRVGDDLMNDATSTYVGVNVTFSIA